MPYPTQVGDPRIAAELNALHRHLRPLLASPAWGPISGPATLARLDALLPPLRALADADPDGLLIPLVQSGHRPQPHYSSQHALFCAVLMHLSLRELPVSPAAATAALRAALTMNLAMGALQDELVERERTPTLAQRQLIDRHPALAAALLRQAGLDDLTPTLVAAHHQPLPAGLRVDQLDEAGQLALLLHRIDVYTAKISARRSRPGLSPLVAARQTCLGSDGRPDALGAALLRAVGMLPPGSWVSLSDERVALVLRRSAHLTLPWVQPYDSQGRPEGPALATGAPAPTVQRLLRPEPRRQLGPDWMDLRAALA